MYIIYSETDHQPRWDSWDKCSGLVHWEDPEDSGGEGGGRGVGMGNTGNSMADSCQCMTKPLKCCEVISLQLIKINEKKKKWNKIISFSILKQVGDSPLQTTYSDSTALCPLPWEISHGTAVFSLSFPVTENMFSCFLSKFNWFVLAVLFVCNALFLITIWLVLWHSGKRILFRVKYGLSRWKSW